MNNTNAYSIADYKFFNAIKLHYLIMAYFLFCSFSIAASQIILFMCGILWLIGLIKKIPVFKFKRSQLDFWIIGYIFVSILAIIFSSDLVRSVSHFKQLSLFLIFFFGVQVLTDVSKSRLYMNIFILGGVINCFYALYRCFYLSEGGLDKRLHGFIRSWMTFSGFIMIMLLILIAKVVWQRGTKHQWAYLLLIVIFFTVIIKTLTRSSWIGLFCGILVLTFLHSRKLFSATVLILIIAGVIASPFLPKTISNRFKSIIDLNDTTNKERIYMARIALNIFKEHPILGIGPGTLQQNLPNYVSDGIDKNWNIPHLHSNVLQNLAEKGLLGLIAWVLIYIKWLLDSCIAFYKKQFNDLGLAAGSIAAVIAFLITGLFEYNFGDSEILMIILFIMALPYSIRKNHTVNLEEAIKDIK
jgi:O-antigen ligase